MAETIQLEDQQVVHALSRIFARTALIETGVETPAPDDVKTEWQRDKASYHKHALRFLRALDRAGYMIERKAD